MNQNMVMTALGIHNALRILGVFVTAGLKGSLEEVDEDLYEIIVEVPEMANVAAHTMC